MIECKKTFVLEGLSVEAMYEYNDDIEDLLYRLKESRDVALSDVFLSPYSAYIRRKYRNFTCIYIPSSRKKSEERGFFALELLFKPVNLKKQFLFLKNKNIKQSLQSYEDRKKISETIELDKAFEVPRKNILLIDDMCTSGSSLLSAYRLLEGHKYKVKALVVCVNEKLIK